jgi:hypothetical protein
MRTVRILLAAALAATATAGCTQVAQLRGVAGAEVSSVRTATNNVLVDEGVAIDVAPVCALEDPVYVCLGSTSDGAEIRSEATVLADYGETTDEYGAYVPADIALVVTVGGTEIFNGKVEDVLVSNGQVDK